MVNVDPVQQHNQHVKDHPDAPVDDVGNDPHEILIDPSIALKRSTRERLPSTRWSDEYVTLTDEGEPECYENLWIVNKNNKKMDWCYARWDAIFVW